jgi:hypothetical protein
MGTLLLWMIFYIAVWNRVALVGQPLPRDQEDVGLPSE